jgi:SAM-dependent methyltransferase
MTREPFSRFSRHYDRFMLKYVNYRAWVDYVERVFGRFNVRPRTILDVACGTGIPTIMLAGRGYRMTGVDRSPEMLAELERKKGELPITTLRADIRDFDTPEPADAAISLYDSINYLLVEEDLVRCFGCVRRSLAAGGLFVFDMNTFYGLSENWGTRTVTRDVGGIYSVWQNAFDRETRVSTLHLSFWEHEPGSGEAAGQKFEEIHQERAYTEEDVGKALAAAGFGERHFFQHSSFLPVGPQTTRMMVVAR